MSSNPPNVIPTSSTPTLSQINPNDVEWQMVCLDLLRGAINYGDGIVHEDLMNKSR